MQIRELMIGDIPAVAEMEARYSGNPWDETSLFTYFLRDDTILLVADENDTLPTDDEFHPETIGFAGLICMPPESDVLDITVLPEKRNRGVGQRLLSGLLARAARKGVDTVYLEVRVSNAPARHLYRKLGFTETGLRKNYYTDPVEDAVTMARRPDQKDG